MARTIYKNKFLSAEDLKKYRTAYGWAYVAYSGNDNFTISDAASYIRGLESLKNDLRKKYEIPAEVDVEFSTIDGAILEV
jgi:hypothetical protein